jgi:DNA-binding NarL/FixJ family response regulator
MTNIHLCPREQEIMQMISDGLTTEFIAHQLGISISRTRDYIATSLKKTDSCSRAQCVARLVSSGVILVEQIKDVE